MTLPVAILAGGLATRLRPVTATIPKALIKVAGQPFACHQLRLLAKGGIKRVVFCIGYLGEQIVEVLKDGSEFGLDVEYVFDGPNLLGTAGALRNAVPQLGDEFFVLYGDSYLDCDYQKVEAAFHASKLPALMTIFKNDGNYDNSNVEFDGKRIIKYDKFNRTSRMQYIDYGLGVFCAGALDKEGAGVGMDLTVVYECLAASGNLAVYEVAKRFYEVGSFAGIVELEHYLENGLAK